MNYWQALQRDVRDRAGTPIVTWISGQNRIELSGTSFNNAICKAGNFLVDELEAAQSSLVRIELGSHWQSAVWNSAAIAAGLNLTDAAEPPYVFVTGGVPSANSDMSTIVRISSHPLGVPDSQVADGEVNGSLAVRSQPDQFFAVEQAPYTFSSTQIDGDSSFLTFADMQEQSREIVSELAALPGQRVALIGQGSHLERCLWHSVIPVEGALSIVLLDQDQSLEIDESIIRQERIDHVVVL